MSSEKSKSVKIGIIGFGTVGGGVGKILLNKSNLLKEKTGIDFQIKKIAVKNIYKKRNVEIPQEIFTTDWEEIVNDPEIDIVVELIGGISPAKEIAIETLKRRKWLITANKHMLAIHWKELFEKARENGVGIKFEASVAGGIPVIRGIQHGLVANKFKEILGILNGTTNYILTMMEKETLSFKKALSLAQERGFAEADPTLDVSGEDAAHKIAILARLAFNIDFDYEEVYREGITQIDAFDISYASELGYKIKLLAFAKENDGVEVGVFPALVEKNHLLSSVDYEFNAVLAYGDETGPVVFYGKGAGSGPTASAVMSDIVESAKIITSNAVKFIPEYRKISLKPVENTSHRYYFRFQVDDKAGVLAKIAGVLGRENISIASVIQKERDLSGGAVPLIIMTHEAREKNVRKAMKEIEKFEFVREKPKVLRVVDIKKSIEGD